MGGKFLPGEIGHLATGHAELIEQLKITPKLRAGDALVEKSAVLGYGEANAIGSLVDELDAKPPRPEGLQTRDVFGAGLRQAVENGVATASIGLEDVFNTDPISKFDVMLIARAATIAVIGAIGEKGAENAMPHVKHGDVLMNGHFKAV